MKKYCVVDYVSGYGDGIHGTPVYDNCGEYFFVNGNNIRNGHIEVDCNTAKISEDEAVKISRPLSSKNTVLVSINGSIGNIGLYGGEKIALGKSVCYVNVDDDYSRDFFKYIFLSTNFQNYIRRVASGSTIKNIAPVQVAEYVFYAPDIVYWNKIGSLLSILDCKIANNNKICAELEAMAKTLYDYWFLQFDFPDEQGRPYKSSGGKMVWNDQLKREIPAGWEVKKLGELISFEKGKIPSDLVNKLDKQHEYSYITIEAANNVQPQFCSGEGMVKTSGETLMVMDGAASGDVYLGFSGVVGSTLAVIRILRSDVSDTLVYLSLGARKDIYSRTNTGSTVPHANRGYIENMYIALPVDCCNFSNQLNELYGMIFNTRKQNQVLASLRDFLLPLLMNGQVKVG